MSIARVYKRLFDRIRDIRVKEFDLIFSTLENPRFSRGLEIGCGDGTQSLLLLNVCDELISTDLDASDLNMPTMLKINFIAADATNLPFEDSSFDLVYSSNVLEHVENLNDALSEIKRVMTDDGVAIICLPNAVWKFLQLALWVPFRLKVLLAKIGEIFWREKKESAPADVGEFGSSKAESKVKFNPWIPPIHGVARTHLEEFALFRMSRWRREFINSGLKIEKSFPLLLYSAWNVGPAFIRNFLEKMGLISSNCFVLRKK